MDRLSARWAIAVFSATAIAASISVPLCALIEITCYPKSCRFEPYPRGPYKSNYSNSYRCARRFIGGRFFVLIKAFFALWLGMKLNPNRTRSRFAYYLS